MEYVPGQNLQDIARDRPGMRMGEAEVAGYTIDLLDALDHAHHVGVIHNDIKPRNVLIAPGDVLKVCDFGIAKRREVNWHRQARWIVGTVAFMAPERIRHEEGTVASDLYSVGATMFNLLDGRPPFGTSPEEAFDGHLQQDVPRSRNIPVDLMGVIDRAMEKSPRDRFRTALEMASELRRLGYGSRFASSRVREEDAGVFDEEERLWALPAPGNEPVQALGGGWEKGDPWLVSRAAPEPEVVAPPVLKVAPTVVIPPRVVRLGMQRAEVPAFRMGTLPVTREEWATFCAAKREKPPAQWGGAAPPVGTERLPVTGITLAAARRYAAWRGMRLPKASEWLAAAAALSISRDGAGGGIGPVDARPFEVSDDGVYDLIGNAWEWVEADAMVCGDGPGVGVVMGGAAGRSRSAGVPVADAAADRAWEHVGLRCAADAQEGA
jgi:hypothetical protein